MGGAARVVCQIPLKWKLYNKFTDAEAGMRSNEDAIKKRYIEEMEKYKITETIKKQKKKMTRVYYATHD